MNLAAGLAVNPLLILSNQYRPVPKNSSQDMQRVHDKYKILPNYVHTQPQLMAAIESM
jgi:hypothetical protein